MQSIRELFRAQPNEMGPTWTASLGRVTDRFDIIAIRVPDEDSEIVRVVLVPHSRFMEYFGPLGHGRLVERLHRGSVGRSERNV
jgi:hypothetical protein